MNDPDLDEPIRNASSQIKDTYRSAQSKDKRHGSTGKSRSRKRNKPQPPAYRGPDDDAGDIVYTMPTRWWYASTGFPLITGTLGPVASAFSICALVENWRVEIPPGGTESDGINIRDPRWLIAVNAVSLVLALIANMSLLLNMARRLSFSIAQPITIVGFWVSSVLLIALISVASHHFRAPGVQNQALTQAYYYACWAAGLYQIISYLMCVTLYGALKRKYDSEFKLTMAQRTLMLQTIAFLTYLLLGALVYSKIEGWKFLDAVYWADFTLLTVGVGDYAPSTHLGRGLLFPFAIGGIVILGLVVSSIRSLVLDRGKKKLSARLTEKIRRRLVKHVEAIHNEHASRSLQHNPNRDVFNELSTGPQDDPRSELHRREVEFQAMRKVQRLSDRRQKWMNLSISTSSFALLWFVGAVVFWRTETQEQGWTYFMSLYFSYTSLLTIGYGDLSPVSNSGKPFFVFWSLLAVPALTILISDMGDTVVKGIKDVTIWLGEISILPSDEGSVQERLEYGLMKATTGVHKKHKKHHKRHRHEKAKPRTSKLHKHLPFLNRLLHPQGQWEAEKSEIGDRIASDFEELEQRGEDEAHRRGDKVAEDEHHYRHLLVSQIRRVWADSTLSTPKQYNYKEWAFFLKLLGEDESSSEFHRAVSSHHHHKDHHQDLQRSQEEQQEGTQHPEEYPTGVPQHGHRIGKWSWIGPRSPLMSDKNEAALLLELLFERLEESLGRFKKSVTNNEHVPDDASHG